MMSFLKLSLLVITLLGTPAATTAVDDADNIIGESYKVWCVGTCNYDKKPSSTTPGVVLMGGGTDTTEAFEWQIKNANGGDFVVLRASGDDAYNQWIYDISVGMKAKLNSVTTILFKNKKGSAETEVLSLLKNAEAIFFAGGDQSQYIDYWVGTEVQTICQQKVANVTIGGTSAGLAILGNWIYSASVGSIESDKALANPYDKTITIVPAFLKFPYLDSIITDTHFVTRDRMGRMLTFVARALADDSSSLSTVRGVGVDEHTALLVETGTGDVTAVGVGTAYVCTAAHDAQVCKSGTPLTFKDVSCTRLSASSQDRYSFKTFKADISNKGIDYSNDIVNGKFTSIPYGII